MKKTKVCTRCKEVKSLNNFYKNNSNKDKLGDWCKQCDSICQKEYQKQNREKIKKYKKEYYEKNKKRILKKAKKYFQKNKEKILNYQYYYNNKYQTKLKSARLKRKFGITLEEYNKLLKQQNGVCAICKQKEIRNFKEKISALAVDHDPKTGKVRGLLCYNCNTTLGRFKENIRVLQNMIFYLNNQKEEIYENLDKR